MHTSVISSSGDPLPPLPSPQSSRRYEGMLIHPFSSTYGSNNPVATEKTVLKIQTKTYRRREILDLEVWPPAPANSRPTLAQHAQKDCCACDEEDEDWTASYPTTRGPERSIVTVSTACAGLYQTSLKPDASLEIDYFCSTPLSQKRDISDDCSTIQIPGRLSLEGNQRTRLEHEGEKIESVDPALLFSVMEIGARVKVRWEESGSWFRGTVTGVDAESTTFDVQYDDKVRGKEVVEKNVTADRIVVLSEGDEGDGEDDTVMMDASQSEGEGGGRGRGVRRGVAASSDSIGLIQRLAQMREDGDLDAQTVNLLPSQVVQLNDSLTTQASKSFPSFFLSLLSLTPQPTSPQPQPQLCPLRSQGDDAVPDRAARVHRAQAMLRRHGQPRQHGLRASIHRKVRRGWQRLCVAKQRQQGWRASNLKRSRQPSRQRHAFARLVLPSVWPGLHRSWR